ncbi:MAG: DUF547 domain-containing protein [Calditrichota bacterium]
MHISEIFSTFYDLMRLAFLILSLTLLPLAAPAWDHSYSLLRDSVLIPFVEPDYVDYQGLLDHRGPLDRFIDTCSRVSFDQYQSFSREQQIAFLINLYNAATLQLILNHWPLTSIREIGGLLVSPWTKKFIRLFDRTIGLGQIQHDILRPEFHDPRLHFALFNTARSGPALPAEPYQPEVLDEQLRRQMDIFLTERTDVNYWQDRTLYLTPIFHWYESDFGKRDGIRALVKPYFPALSDSTTIRYTEYDWSLNFR